MADVTISQLTQGVPAGNNVLPYSTGSNTLGVPASAILQNVGNVGIGTTSPSYKLVVSEGGAQGFEVQTSTSSRIDLLTYNRSTQLYTDAQINSKDFIIRTGIGGLSLAENLRVNGNGAVTKPNQPAFAVGAISKAYIGPNPKLNSFELLQNINVGNGFNINTGIFTAPAGGIYSISGMIRLDPGPSTYIYPTFYINDTIYWDIAGDTTQPLPGLSISNNVNGFSTANFSLLIKLNQGDALQFGYSTPGNAQITYTVYGQTCFYGYLLG